MKLIDWHSRWGTERGFRGKFGTADTIEAAKKYWKWNAEPVSEDEMVAYFRKHNARVVLDTGKSSFFTKETPVEELAEQHDYGFAFERKHRDVILGHWLHFNPMVPAHLPEFRRCIDNRVGFLGIGAGPFPSAADPAWEPYYRLCMDANLPVMIFVGMTAHGAGMPGGLGLPLDLTHPRHLDITAATHPDLKIVAARPGWPWQDETNATIIHKGNVWYELHGWSPKYYPESLKYEISHRLKDRILFGADYPMLKYERLIADWRALGYSEEILEKVFYKNAERFLGLLGLE
jgi:hypothetical protein